jgi:chromosome segregation ATPase
MGVAIKKTMENRSALGDTESLTQMSGQSNHTTGHLSGGGNSHATTENIDQLRMMLEHARMEEKQVMVIHKKLEKEVEKLMEREIMANNQRLNINLELQTVSLEHERLERQVEILHKENDDLRLKLSIMEEREGDRGLDDVLDSMEAKIKQLKLKRTERRVSSPRRRG